MYIVTGGAGFIGSNVVRSLNDAGVEDILVVDDLTDGDKFLNIRDVAIRDYVDKEAFLGQLGDGRFGGERIEAVLHQGACADTTNHDGVFMMRSNYDYSKAILHHCIEHRVPLVYASSAATYGASESFAEVPANEKPLNVYGYSKLQFDRYVRRLQPSFASTVVGLRYFNVYGPNESHKGKMASMVYQLYRQLKGNGVARLFKGTDGYDDGGQLRDFVFVGDVAKVNLFFAQGPQRFGVFNCGTGKARSFNDIARCLIDELDSGAIEYFPLPDSLRGKYQSFTEANLDQLKKVGYGQDFTSLEDGIRASLKFWESEPAG